MTDEATTRERLEALLDAQDQVVSRHQATAAGLTRHALANRRSRHGWQQLLPGVFLCHRGEPARRQLLVAGLLYAGANAAIDDVDACRFHGLRALPVEDDKVFVVTPWGDSARSTGFLVVRRSCAPITVVRTERLRYLDPAAAVIAACRRPRSDRAVLAALSEAVQRDITTYADLLRAHVRGPVRNAAPTDAALAHVGAGVRSAPEGMFRMLAEASLLLPPLLYNCLLRLPSGQLISPDALDVDAGLVHETNGRRAHRREDLFDEMQERHDTMTEAGLVVVHSSPRRLDLRGREVIAQFERLHARHAGRGLPPGVEIVRLASTAA